MINRRNGFSLVELMVVSSMTVVLAVLLSSAWVGMGQTAAGLIGRSRLVQERDLAVVALGRDLGGCSAEPAAQSGETVSGRWLNWDCPNNSLLASNQDLKLYYDGGTDANGNPLPNTVVQYLVQPDPNPGRFHSDPGAKDDGQRRIGDGFHRRQKRVQHERCGRPGQ